MSLDSGDALSAGAGFIYGLVTALTGGSILGAVVLTIITTVVGFLTKKVLDEIFTNNKKKDEKS